MYRKIMYSVFFACVLVPACAFADWFGPSDYDECIFEEMKGVQSDVAARLVRQSCLKKFPPQKAKSYESLAIRIERLQKLSGRAGIGPLGYFSGNIYNGNSDWTVTELTISIAEKDWLEKKDLKSKEDGKPGPRLDRYRIKINIPPYTNKSFSISVDWPKDVPYDWNIFETKGYK